MNDIMTVDELLASKNLTREEWELHRDLIEDCRKNEARINECCAVTKENIEKVAGVLDAISVKMVALSVALETIIGEAEDVSLRMLPEHKFFRE
ncbi:MAG: hypothetical protein A4E60_01521 [Syntrophorhabdus sp. PtaB.Bin047]|jgi:hypothetical protein|nr:MAG: hypothetical protein A4E60_01521 [Syntrophorhabdus sp. PtaB.Bin047]